MYDILVSSHSGMRWLVLLFLIITCIMALTKWLSKSEWTKGLGTMALITLIVTHIQLIIGVILYFVSPRFTFSAASMKNDIARFFMVEHSLLMLVAIALITIGYSVSKKKTGIAKVKNLAIYYLIALIIILVMIPWPWQGYGTSWM